MGYGTPRTTWIASAAIVPNTATMATVAQYVVGRYLWARSWYHSVTPRPTAPIPAARAMLWAASQSEAASPMPVVRTFTTQNTAVTSGTFASKAVDRRVGSARVRVSVTSTHASNSDAKQNADEASPG